MAVGLSCRKPRRQIREIFVHGALAPAAVRRLWSHLRACDDCRARYDRALRMQRVIASGGVQLPAALELELLVPLVTTQPEPQRGTLGDLLAPRWLVPALSLCLVVAIGSVLFWQMRMPEETWMSRSIGSATLAVRAFCRTGEEIRSLSTDPGPQELVSCSPGSALLFAVISDEIGYLYAVQWDRGQPVWHLPESSADEPLPVAVSTELGPIPVEIEIDSQEQIIISFVRTPAPVPTDRVETWLETWDVVDLPSGVAIVERRVPIEPAQRKGEP